MDESGMKACAICKQVKQMVFYMFTPKGKDICKDCMHCRVKGRIKKDIQLEKENSNLFNPARIDKLPAMIIAIEIKRRLVAWRQYTFHSEHKISDVDFIELLDFVDSELEHQNKEEPLEPGSIAASIPGNTNTSRITNDQVSKNPVHSPEQDVESGKLFGKQKAEPYEGTLSTVIQSQPNSPLRPSESQRAMMEKAQEDHINRWGATSRDYAKCVDMCIHSRPGGFECFVPSQEGLANFENDVKKLDDLLMGGGIGDMEVD